MSRNKLGETVAHSMNEILESEEHLTLFAKAKNVKKCCECKGKCTKKCPCKSDDGKCKKSCEACSAIVEKKAGQGCCDCKGECKDCPCKSKCADCSNCGDGMMAQAIESIHEDLLAISAMQEQLGLSKASGFTLQALLVMQNELKAKASSDTNEVSLKEVMTPAEVEVAEDLDSIWGYRFKQPGKIYENLADEVEEIDPVADLLVSESPRQYRVLMEHPELAKLSPHLIDPEHRQELENRVDEVLNPKTVQAPPEDMFEISPVSDITGLPTSIAPASEIEIDPFPNPAANPNVVEDFGYGEEGAQTKETVAPGKLAALEAFVKKYSSDFSEGEDKAEWEAGQDLAHWKRINRLSIDPDDDEEPGEEISDVYEPLESWDDIYFLPDPDESEYRDLGETGEILEDSELDEEAELPNLEASLKLANEEYEPYQQPMVRVGPNDWVPLEDLSPEDRANWEKIKPNRLNIDPDQISNEWDSDSEYSMIQDLYFGQDYHDYDVNIPKFNPFSDEDNIGVSRLPSEESDTIDFDDLFEAEQEIPVMEADDQTFEDEEK